MKRYDVFLMVPHMQWEGVEAESEEEAINQCDADGFAPEMFDFNMTVAVEQPDQEEEEYGKGMLHS